jgi:hypothetical protein
MGFLMSNLKLDIDAIYEGYVPNAIIQLTCPTYTSTVFTSPIVSDLVIGGNVATASPFDDYASPAQQKIQQAVAAGGMAAGSLGFGGFLSKIGLDFNKVSNYLNKQRWQTVQLYQGSSGGDLTVQMVFIVTGRSNINRYRQAIELTACTFPDPDYDLAAGTTKQQQNPAAGVNTSYYSSQSDKYLTDAAVLRQVMRAPCGYRIDPTGVPKGTWTVQIGRYFRAGGFVLKSATMNQSKERLGNDEAMITTVDCQFEPSMAVMSNQFRGWFTGI